MAMTDGQRHDRRVRICTMWLAGLKTVSIAQEIGVSRGVMLREAHAIGLPKRSNGPHRSVNLWRCVVAWARMGHSADDIADKIGLSAEARRLMTVTQ